MKKGKIFMGQLPEIGGIGISVFSKTEKGCLKKLKKAFYDMKKSLDYWNMSDEYFTFKGAMDYFGGRIFEIDMNETYDDNIRN
tara:strand:- start:1737 stop:1985 length:249 start_codon:yes stop_codon:yes gene_type:complete